MTFALLLTALVIILIGAETFTNALEHLGERLKISEGVTGSIFAAVGTALPETMVPVVAILTSAGTQQVREEVGVGAIIGAPLMLSTLTMFLMAAFAAHRRGWADHFHPERAGLRRDLSWFLLAFGVSTAAIFIPHHVTSMRALLAIALVLIYFIYLMLTVRASARLVSDGHGTEADNPLFLARLLGRFGLRENMPVILAQLPEKVNSILWIRRRRDTLAFGNITGAMVFQGSLLPAIGIMLTPWEPRPEVLAGMILTLLASGYLLAMLRRGGLRPYHLIVNGLCYAAYLITVAI